MTRAMGFFVVTQGKGELIEKTNECLSDSTHCASDTKLFQPIESLVSASSHAQCAKFCYKSLVMSRFFQSLKDAKLSCRLSSVAGPALEFKAYDTQA